MNSQNTFSIADAGNRLLSLNEVCLRLAVGERKPHISTAWRWCRTGYRGVKLEHVRVGRRVAVPEEALARFVEAMTRADAEAFAEASTPQPERRQTRRRSAAQTSAAAAEARSELQQAGVLS